MEYVKGDAYFANSEKKIKQYYYLNKDKFTDILIIGGGINGAVLNYYLSQKYDVTLVEKSMIGRCCTSCATVLCEYQLDDYADELTDYMTSTEIVDVYKMGLNSIDKIEKFIQKHGNKCHFYKAPTLLYTTNVLKIQSIEKEYEFRKQHGFDCELLLSGKNPYAFNFERGLYTPNGGCSFNPYLLTKQLIENSQNQESIFENTKIDFIKKCNSGYEAYTNYGQKIVCNRIILATGFNWELAKKKDLCSRFVTYTIVTKPIEGLNWYQNTLVQDDLDPYHYLRNLPDNRLIFGGEDKKWHKKISTFSAKNAYKKLVKSLKKLLPQYANKIVVDYKLCGCFGSTDNNLGIIGKSDKPNIFYFHSCGANGIINAFYGVDIIDKMLLGQTDPLEHLFAYNRKPI